MVDDFKWVVVASRSQAKFFEYDGLTTKLTCVNTIANTAGRNHSREFGQDRVGARRGKYSDKTTAQDGGKNPHEVAAVRFALLLCDYITKSFQQKNSLQAMVFAEPHLMGLIKQNLPAKLVQQIGWVPKDLAKATTSELEKHLNP